MRRSVLSGSLIALAIGGLLLTGSFAFAASAGKVYLGIAASAQESGAGVLVHHVSPDSPAALAGLKGGDRIVKAENQDVKTFADLESVLAAHKAGDKITLEVMRNQKQEKLTITLANHPERKSTEPNRAFLGVQTQPLSKELKEHLGLTVDQGVLVTHVMDNSPAAKAGLAEEDVITHVGSTAIATPQELREAIQKAGAGKEVALEIARGKETKELKARLGEVPAGIAQGPAWGPQMPEGVPQIAPDDFRHFSLQGPSWFMNPEKVQELEKRIQQLENRVHELEQKLAQPKK